MYRTHARFVLVLSLAIVSSASKGAADAGPEVVYLTPDSAAELGFSVSATSEGGTVVATITGPEIGPNNCRARRVGAALFDTSERQITAFVNDIPDDTGRPKAFASVANDSGRMEIAFDYLCPEPRVLEGRRYSIRSLSAYFTSSRTDR